MPTFQSNTILQNQLQAFGTGNHRGIKAHHLGHTNVIVLYLLRHFFPGPSIQLICNCTASVLHTIGRSQLPGNARKLVTEPTYLSSPKKKKALHIGRHNPPKLRHPSQMQEQLLIHLKKGKSLKVN